MYYGSHFSKFYQIRECVAALTSYIKQHIIQRVQLTLNALQILQFGGQISFFRTDFDQILKHSGVHTNFSEFLYEVTLKFWDFSIFDREEKRREEKWANR